MTGTIVIVILLGEDGPSIDRITKGELLKRLREGYYGEGAYAPEFCPAGTVPDLERANRMLTIIDGDVVVPRTVRVVEEYEL